MKQAHVLPGDPPDVGDQWVWVAIDGDSKLAISFRVDQRSSEAAVKLMLDLRARIIGRPLISTDGMPAYPDAVSFAFDGDADHGVLSWDDSQDLPVKVRRVISGNPDRSRITTAHVERSNLTLRMGSRRFTRKSNGFSRRLRNLQAAVSLHYTAYNFCRVHRTLRTTPAVRAGVADHIWSIGELVEASGGLFQAGGRCKPSSACVSFATSMSDG